jgi:DnaJ family protein C protein 28
MPNIEELLQKAMQEGKFDNLAGKGKPLHLEENNPHADSDWELAYHMIKESGYTLPWIETLHEIENDLEAARKELQRAWKWYMIYLSAEVSEGKIRPEWERALEAYKDQIDKINQRIRDYNLQVPNARFQRPVLSFEQEVDKVKSSQFGA